MKVSLVLKGIKYLRDIISQVLDTNCIKAASSNLGELCS